MAKVLKKRGLHKHAQASIIVVKSSDWIQAHLPDFKDDIFVNSLKDATLHVSCRHSIASQELHAMCEDLQHFLLKEFPDAHIESIRIQRK